MSDKVHQKPPTATGSDTSAPNEALDRLGLARAAGGVGTWEWDIEKGIAFGSPESCRFYGLTVGETVSYQEWIALIHPDDREHVEQQWREALSGSGAYDTEFRVGSADRQRWLWARGVVHFRDDGEPVRSVGVNIDITTRKRIEQEREKAEAQFKRANALKDDFLAMLGHELRNPLGAIANGIELLRGNTTDEHRAWAEEMIARQTRQLKRLVDDILEVSRVARGQLDIRPEVVSLSASVEAARDAVRDRLQENERELNVNLPSERIHLFVDPARIQQILGNLLSNAIKYTQEGGRIDLTAERAGNRVLIHITDDGEGLSEQHLDVIFEPFVRVSKSLRRAGSGLGIGLTLVKKLAELHGGTVSVRSDGPKSGCTFTVELPVHQGEPNAHDANASREPRPLRILIIDDNKDLALGLKKRLDGLGHETTLAYDGPEGIEAVRQTKPHVVLVDVGLPTMDGYHVAEKLRQENLSGTHIAAISGFKERGEETLADEVFDQYFLKPVDPEELNAWLARVATELEGNGGTV
jgi:two-component system CheB/CheR fusion protein